ncbi:MAG: polyketide synthase dehydratase domain-containing protein, partial [Coriobacteriia bacterium]|nr:polyketide synthase dehydratase domain-containing protein [Coriobacteriia bacterium]
EWLGSDLPALEELDIVAPLVFDGEHARTLRLSLNVRDGGFQIKSVQRLSADEWTLHATGRVLASSARPRDAHIESVSSAAEPIERETHYSLASSLGLDYGPAFRGLAQARVDGDRLEATLAPAVILDAEDAYLIHPAVLDICYQSLIDFSRAEIEAGQGVALLPVKVGRIDLYSRGAASHFRARLRRRGARSVMADFELLDASGQLVASMSGCRFRLAPLMRGKQTRPSTWPITPWLCPHPADCHGAELPSSEELAGFLRTPLDGADAQRRAWFKEALPLFEALVLSFAYQACEVLTQRGEPFMNSSSPYARWLTGLLRLEGLLIEEEGGGWSLTESDLPAAADIWNTLLREHPACLPQLTLLGRVGLHLPDILAGKTGGREVSELLRRSPALETLHDDPAYSGMLLAIEHALHRIAANLSAHRRLRVLEISAGPSELPRSLAAALPGDRLDYVLALTDESAAQRQQVEYRDFVGVTVTGVNGAELTLITDRQLPETFDVVILRHALHQAASPQILLAQAWRWLAAGGQLLIAERHPDWSADFVSGLDPDWWQDELFVHAGSASPRSSLLPPAVWEDALWQEGFDDVGCFIEPAADDLSAGAYVLFGRRPLREAMELSVPQATSWLLLADDASSRLAENLRLRLESLGQRVVLDDRVREGHPADISHVVHLRGWNSPVESTATLLADVTRDVQSLAVLPVRPLRLWFITCGGALASGLPPVCSTIPVQAALWGFGRVVMNEHPEFECTLIDLACDSEALEIPARLENELLRPDGANEIVLSDSARHVLVMREGRETGQVGDDDNVRFRLDFHMPGKLRNLRWLPLAERSLGEGEVEVRPLATGLNFRDVMYLMGLLPDEAVENGFA